MDLDSSLNHNALDGKTFELLLRNPVMFNQVSFVKSCYLKNLLYNSVLNKSHLKID